MSMRGSARHPTRKLGAGIRAAEPRALRPMRSMRSLSVEPLFRPLLELARGFLIEMREHQALVAVFRGFRFCRGSQDELRDLAKALRLLLFHRIPPPLPRSNLLPACWEGYPARTRSGRDTALPPLCARAHSVSPCRAC